ncbi:MAG: SAM-dependent methyltransferase [Clostridia bacterium]|nr:SAM-dependent methyltransferase [Clostridia bacterium]
MAEISYRLTEIFNAIPTCEVFADIGCDHGYITQKMLQTGKCKKAIFSDISAKCLQKASELLKDYVEKNLAKGVVSNGFEKIEFCTCALIAGMGGEEIIEVLKKAKSLPYSLVLQPMKNCEKVRKTLIELGYKILKDYTFNEGKRFYDLIFCEKGEDSLTQEEIEFGRTNLTEKTLPFVNKIKLKINQYKKVIAEEKITNETKEKMLLEIERLEKYV